MRKPEENPQKGVKRHPNKIVQNKIKQKKKDYVFQIKSLRRKKFDKLKRKKRKNYFITITYNHKQRKI